jgi:hypothetical protein
MYIWNGKMLHPRIIFVWLSTELQTDTICVQFSIICRITLPRTSVNVWQCHHHHHHHHQKGTRSHFHTVILVQYTVFSLVCFWHTVTCFRYDACPRR